jgi:putative sigma-54 modulation protein
MQLVVKGKNTKVSNELRDHVTKKVTKLDRYLDNILDAQVEISETRTRSAGELHTIQITLTANGTFLRAEESASDAYAALDAVLSKIQSQIVRYKERRREKGKAVEVPAVEEREAEEGETIVRTKQFSLRPMSSGEAIDQMELLGHDFFVFLDAASGQVNVVYRRDDGGYGLLQPDLS